MHAISSPPALARVGVAPPFDRPPIVGTSIEEGSVGEERREGDAGRVVLASDAGGRAEVTAHGAHVIRWTDASGGEVLYLSPRSKFGEGESIRGGIPVIFPQFADLGTLPKHGFARTAEWEIVERDASRAVLRLTDSPATRAIWDHAFEAELRVALGDALTVALAVRNTGADAFGFTCALHNYFRVEDVRRAAVLGLRGVRFHDKVAGGERTQEDDELRFTGETDRVFFDAAAELRIRDEEGGRTIVITRHGFPDAVVWNPWADKARAMDDLGEDQFPRFVCVEAAHVGSPVHLQPGERWEARQTVSATRD
jgi:glucose-6-phosphate 1-epimerase